MFKKKSPGSLTAPSSLLFNLLSSTSLFNETVIDIVAQTTNSNVCSEPHKSHLQLLSFNEHPQRNSKNILYRLRHVCISFIVRLREIFHLKTTHTIEIFFHKIHHVPRGQTARGFENYLTFCRGTYTSLRMKRTFM